MFGSEGSASRHTLVSFPGAFLKIYQVYDPGVSVSRRHNIEDGRTDAVSPNRDA